MLPFLGAFSVLVYLVGDCCENYYYDIGDPRNLGRTPFEI